MKTLARPFESVRRQALLVAVSLLAIIVVPVAARATCHVETQRNVFAGLHRPALHAAHAVTHAFRGSYAHGRHADIHDHSRGEQHFRWSLRDGEFHSNCGVSTGDLRGVTGAPGSRESFLWISQDGDEWVIRDRALIQRARASVEPMQRLGQEMGRLGGEMGRIGAQQGRFGAEMGRLGARQGVLAARLALLELRADDDPAIEREAAAIERKMDELSRQQDQLDERQDTSVEGRMDDLGEQMDRLGDQMERLSQRAEWELRALAREAIAARRAERILDRGGL
jgi:hypothetical protein